MSSDSWIKEVMPFIFISSSMLILFTHDVYAASFGTLGIIVLILRFRMFVDEIKLLKK